MSSPKPYTLALPSPAEPMLERRPRVLLNGTELPGVVSLTSPPSPAGRRYYVLEIDADLFEVAPPPSEG